MTPTRLAFFLALAAVAGMAQAASARSVPEAIYFTGYCDGITHIRLHKSGYMTGTHSYAGCSGLADTAMIGPVAQKRNRQKFGFSATDASYAQFGISLAYVVKSDGTWTLLSPEGGAINHGTWDTTGSSSLVHGSQPTSLP